MYSIRYQKMKKLAKGVAPANAYTLDEYDSLDDFLMGVVDIVQFRKRGYKYRLMEVVADDDDIAVRFDWQKTTPTE